MQALNVYVSWNVQEQWQENYVCVWESVFWAEWSFLRQEYVNGDVLIKPN